MRTAALALLALTLTLSLPAPAAAEAPTTHSCVAPSAGLVALGPCSVSGTVTRKFLVKVVANFGNAGNVLVQARGPQGSAVDFVCPIAYAAAACSPPVQLWGAVPGTWTFTARPAVAGVGASAYVRLEVTVE